MGVVTKYGTGYKDPTAVKMIEAVFAEATERSINSQLAVASGDSATSILYVGKVPSNALISPRSQVFGPAVASLTDFSLGFAGAPKALMSSVDIHAGGAFSAVSAVGIANYTKRAWQLAGLSSDPGGTLDIFATLGADAAGAATIHAEVLFKK